eukprot:4847365-Pleurochrysis_carterae.AAC.1
MLLPNARLCWGHAQLKAQECKRGADGCGGDGRARALVCGGACVRGQSSQSSAESTAFPRIERARVRWTREESQQAGKPRVAQLLNKYISITVVPRR